jgi:hypothetical protein
MKYTKIEKSDSVQLVIAGSLDKFLHAADEMAGKAVQDDSFGLNFAREIDTFFREEVWSEGINIDPLPATLAINAYYSFMGATRVALSGHLVAVFPIARQALEYACYCYLMSKKPDLQDVWVSRHADKAALKASRKAFGSAMDNCCKMLSHKHSDLSDWLKGLYQSTIDFGAHPNVRSVFPHIDIEDGGSHWKMNLICLYDKAHPKHQSGLVLAAEVGFVASTLIALSVPNHELTKDFARFEELRCKLAAFSSINEENQKSV